MSEFGPVTLRMRPELLSSQAYYLRDEDLWTKIDYSAKAETWMKPLTKGDETGIVEIPANWFVLLFQRLQDPNFHWTSQVLGRFAPNDVSEITVMSWRTANIPL